jgi:hypothetical protein
LHVVPTTVQTPLAHAAVHVAGNGQSTTENSHEKPAGRQSALQSSPATGAVAGQIGAGGLFEAKSHRPSSQTALVASHAPPQSQLEPLARSHVSLALGGCAGQTGTGGLQLSHVHAASAPLSAKTCAGGLP